VFETLREDEGLAFCQGRENNGELPTILSLTPASDLLPCDFLADTRAEERLPPKIRDELIRFAQEAISNAVRLALTVS
jgi:hypothetical protein